MAFAITEPNAGSNSHKDHHHRRVATAATGSSRARVFISCIDQAQAVLVGPQRELRNRVTPRVVRGAHRCSWFTATTLIEMELVSPERQFQALSTTPVRLPADALVGAEDAAIAQLFKGLEPRAHHSG